MCASISVTEECPPGKTGTACCYNAARLNGEWIDVDSLSWNRASQNENAECESDGKGWIRTACQFDKATREYMRVECRSRSPSLTKYHTHILTLSGDGTSASSAHTGARHLMRVLEKIRVLEARIEESCGWEKRVGELGEALKVKPENHEVPRTVSNASMAAQGSTIDASAGPQLQGPKQCLLTLKECDKEPRKVLLKRSRGSAPKLHHWVTFADVTDHDIARFLQHNIYPSESFVAIRTASSTDPVDLLLLERIIETTDEVYFIIGKGIARYPSDSFMSASFKRHFASEKGSACVGEICASLTIDFVHVYVGLTRGENFKGLLLVAEGSLGGVEDVYVGLKIM
ncbi:hypothetical protein DFH29DRAFT_879825 [Suillus ampliporus]|nr:hypothetical protein DFH29DRAFT_879825 [Suillus ampliporus]